MVVWIPLVVAASVLLVCMFAEWRHSIRTRRVAHLAFGKNGSPAAWAIAAPWIRCLGVSAAAWGASTLLLVNPSLSYDKPPRAASKHLLICLDVSPSMTLVDAGPDVEKISRAAWSGKLASAVLDRLDTETTRVTLVAFYTDALPVVRETFDKEVVTNALDGLPMYVAFEPGSTSLVDGVRKSLELSRAWPSDSTLFVVVSDGDANAQGTNFRVPDSIADSIVIGVGDPHRSTSINGHPSKQVTTSLKRLAANLGGTYHQGNTQHLPTSVLSSIDIVNPESAWGLGLRELGLVTCILGTTAIALLQAILIWFGVPGSFRAERKTVARRSLNEEAMETSLEATT